MDESKIALTICVMTTDTKLNLNPSINDKLKFELF